MIIYKDMTYCINRSCRDKCDRYLTKKIKECAKEQEMDLSVAYFSCANTESKKERKI